MTNTKELKITRGEILIYFYIAILTIAKSIGLSAENKAYYILFALGLSLGVFKITSDKFNRKETIILISGMIIGCLDFFIGHETTMLFSCLVLICLKNIKIEKILKLMFWIKSLLFISIVLLTVTKVLDNNSIMFWRDSKYIERYSFVYGHPNTAHLNLSIIIFLWIYIYYDKINILNIAIFEIINFLFYNLTLSRTGFIITAVFLFIAYLFKKNEYIKKIFCRISKKYFIYMVIITIFFGLLYGTNRILLLSKINEITSGRLYYINYFLRNIPLPMIGKGSYGRLMIDNGYMSLIYNGGILAFVWFTFLSLKTTKYLSEKKMYKEILIMTILLTYSLAESYYMNIILNFSLFFFANYIYNNKVEEKKNESSNTDSNI